MPNYKTSYSNYRNTGGGFRRPAASYQASAFADAAPVVAAVKPVKKALRVEGNAGLWVTLQKVSDPASGWVKTTRATVAGGGVLVNTCSRNGAVVVSEALCFVPGAKLISTAEGVVLA